MTHAKPPKSPCAHRRYRMSCDEYDALVERAGARCEICRRAGEDTGHGYLVIDHDDRVGIWAVRGLLCSRCNLQVAYLRLPADETNAYMANAWYLREHGIEPAAPGPKRAASN